MDGPNHPEREKVWPAPDAEGRFSPADCEAVSFSEKGADATIYVVQTAEGWRRGYEASIADARVDELPIACSEIFMTREMAVSIACGDLETWAQGHGGSKKARKQAAAIEAWAIEQRDWVRAA